MRVLVVEDHSELADTIADGLRREGMAVDVANDGAQGLYNAQVYEYDVVVLDRDLPKLHGDEVTARMIEAGARPRILMLTASAGVHDRVEGLGIGADDYLTKPFAFAELVARVRALSRRAQPARAPVLEAGGLRLDPGGRLVTRDGQRLDLSAKEFTVLELLMGAGDGAVGRGDSRPRLGRDSRPVQQRRQGDDQPAAAQARRAVPDRDGARWRLPDLTPAPPARRTRRPAAGRPALPRRVSLRLRLTLLYGACFLVGSGAVLAVTYLIVARDTSSQTRHLRVGGTRIQLPRSPLTVMTGASAGIPSGGKGETMVIEQIHVSPSGKETITWAPARSASTRAAGAHRTVNIGSATERENQRYAACVRSNGVPDYPNPGVRPGGGAMTLRGTRSRSTARRSRSPGRSCARRSTSVRSTSRRRSGPGTPRRR